MYMKLISILVELLRCFWIGQIISIQKVLGAYRNVSGKLVMKLAISSAYVFFVLYVPVNDFSVMSRRVFLS